jgi:X-X-X-Leu-X-X-Gly heptad repeat protein
MATTSSRSAADGAAQAADGAAQAADGAARAAAAARREERAVLVERPVIRRPIVYKRRKSGGRKRKYSRGMKDPQKLERGFVGAVERLARGVTDGLSEYRKERNRSARRKRDGAIRDAVRNVSRGLRDGLTTAAKAPTDFSRHVTTKRLTRLVMPPIPRPPFGGWGWNR